MSVIKSVILVSILALISAEDIKSRKIPNKYIIAMVVLWIPVSVLDRSVTLSSSLLGFFAAGIFLYAAALITKGGVGGGDVKLAAASGLYLGLAGIFYGITYGLVLSAVYSLVMVLSRRMTLKDYIPLGPFLSAGILIAYFMK